MNENNIIHTAEGMLILCPTRMPSNQSHDHPQMSTLTWWHSYANLTCIPWRYMGRAKMNFLCQGVWKLSYYSLKILHLVRRGHFPSHDKDGGHIIGSAIPENTMLHTNLMVLSFS